MIMNSKTKLVCTIGPSSNTLEIIKEMIKNGMNVARLNFSHGTHESHRAMIKLVRQAASELNVYVGILQDLCGPKIRLGKLPDEGVPLIQGETIVLIESGSVEASCLPVDYPNIHKELKIGERILIADGMMDVIVEKIEDKKVYCKVINGGVAFTRKGVNLPQSVLNIPAFSIKDKNDLLMGLEEQVDFVALSFVRSAKDLDEIRDIISKSEFKPKLIAKIEKPQAVDNLQEIMHVVDAVMVARGDLGVEMPLELIPHIQKQIILMARGAGVMVITATQMLQSMVKSPRPTRGETTDVANAVLDGTDALMLSDETANGQYPALAVETLSRIARAAEPFSLSSLSIDSIPLDERKTSTWGIGRAACWLAKDVGAKAIVCLTTTGYAAYCISRFRPDCEVVALALSDEVCRKITLIWGANAMKVAPITSTDAMLTTAINKVKEAGFASVGDKIIITAGLPFGTTRATNFLRIVEVS